MATSVTSHRQPEAAGNPYDRGVDGDGGRLSGRAARDHVVVDVVEDGSGGGQQVDHLTQSFWGGQMVEEDVDYLQLQSPESLTDKMCERLRDERSFRGSSIAWVLRTLAPNVPVDNYDVFTPNVVSIGPVHWDESLGKMEDLKWVMLNKRLRERRPHDPRSLLYEFVGGIWRLEGHIRLRYKDGVTPSTSPLVLMMVLDGCYILQLLEDHYFWDKYQHSSGYNTAFSLLRNDLTMLENQIPLFVLQKLSDLSGHTGSAVVIKLALEFLAPDCPSGDEAVSWMEQSKPQHLLHLKLLSYYLVPYLGPAEDPMVSTALPSGGIQLRRGKGVPLSATELRAAGIKFKEKKSDSILDVSFDRRTGELSIPHLVVTSVTMSLFRNLVAFEQSLPSTTLHFTSYLLFMDDMVSTADDVRQLARSGIVRHYLASDEEAAKFFNTVCHDVGEGRNKNPRYGNIEADIERYCSAPHHRWAVKLRDDYLSSPWTVISVVGAAVALFLTAVQSYFSAFPKAD